MIIVILAGVASLAIMSAIVGAGASVAFGRTVQCAAFAGSQWQLPVLPYSTGTRYRASNDGSKYSCAQIDAFARKFIAMHFTGAGRITGGPPGMICTASAGKNDHPYEGQCSGSKGRTPRFSWSND